MTLERWPLRVAICSSTVCKRRDVSENTWRVQFHGETRLYVYDLMLSLDMQGHFTAAVNNVISALNARHCMSRAIAAYTELHMSAYKQRKSAPGRDAVNKQQQEKAGSP